MAGADRHGAEKPLARQVPAWWFSLAITEGEMTRGTLRLTVIHFLDLAFALPRHGHTGGRDSREPLLAPGGRRVAGLGNGKEEGSGANGPSGTPF